MGHNRYLLDGVTASSVWWHDMDWTMAPNDSYELRVYNDTDEQQAYHADLIFKEHRP